MTVVVHHIQLRPGIASGQFEDWVRGSDYPSCPNLPSVLAFSVQRGMRAGEYFEIIEVSSEAEFQRDMLTATFHRLEAGFSAMATVVGEWTGEPIEPGYRAARARSNSDH
ncbi:MAG TPA: hypothetical protein VGH27_33695 [Streptosporangiaceae bacterium]|jgi:hypothetical protein